MTLYSTTSDARRVPMREARRQHIHGKIVSLAEQAKEVGEPSLLVGVLAIVGVFAAATGAFVAFGDRAPAGLAANALQSPIAGER